MKYAGFDTSFTMKAIRGKLDIEDIVPLDQSKVIPEEVIIEHFLDRQNNFKCVDTKIKFYKEHAFFVLASLPDIMTEEYQNRPITIIHALSTRLLDSLNQDPSSLEFQQFADKYKDNYAKIHRDKDSVQFDQIPTANKNVVSIRAADIHAIARTDSIIIPIPFFPEEQRQFKISKGKIACRRLDVQGKEQYAERIFRNFKKEFPTFFNVAVFYSFYKSLLKPSNFVPKEDPWEDRFTVYLDGQGIVIKRTFLVDLRIALSALNVVDSFYTCDKGQAYIIEKLWPEYKGKVNLINPCKKYP